MFPSPKDVALARERPFFTATRALFMRLFLTAAAAALLALPSQAQVLVPASYSGDTSVDPEGTFQRPVGADCDVLSGFGTDVAYQTRAFSVSESGTYDFESVQSYDGYLFLYEGAFNPADQCAGFLNGNDDGFGGIGTSNFSNALTSGTTYVIVTAGYGNGDVGSYTNTVSGPAGSLITGDGFATVEVSLSVTPLNTDVSGGEKARFAVTVTNNGEEDYTGTLTVSIDGTPVRVNSGVVGDGTSKTFVYKLNFTGRPDGVYGVSFTIASDELGGEVETEGPFLVVKGGFGPGPGGERYEPFATTVGRLKDAGDYKALEEVLAERAALVQGIGVEQGVQQRGPVQPTKQVKAKAALK